MLPLSCYGPEWNMGKQSKAKTLQGGTGGVGQGCWISGEEAKQLFLAGNLSQLKKLIKNGKAMMNGQ